LIAIASLLLNGANKFLSFIAKLVNVKKDSINRMHATASLYWKDFQEILPQVVAALKFVLSEECGAVISALKRMAWNENADERTGSSEMDVNIMPDGIYSLYYWDDPDEAPRSLFSDQKDLEIEDDDDEDEISKNGEIFRGVHLTMEFLAKKILALGMLQGESKEVILQIAAAKKLSVLDLHFYTYTHFSSEKYL
jgi:hypothetical protein